MGSEYLERPMIVASQVYGTQLCQNFDSEIQDTELLHKFDFELVQPDDYRNKVPKINKIRPSTSTEIPLSQKFKYKKYQEIPATQTTKGSSTVSTTLPARSSLQALNTSFSSIPSSDSNNLAIANHSLLKQVLREVKLLRREVKQLKSNNTTPPSLPASFANIPCSTSEDFQELEEIVKRDDKSSKVLESIFEKVLDQSLEKFVRNCLATILIDEVAAQYSWFGKNKKIPVKSFQTLNIIKECALKKFPTSRPCDILTITKKWFNYAKDRMRRSKEKT